MHVVAGVLRRENTYLIAQRKSGGTRAAKWEFPGGKVEGGENPPQSLARELFEEFGIHAEIGNLIGESVFDYGDVSVQLSAYEVTSFVGEISLNDHQAIQWVTLRQLLTYDLADADLPIAQTLIAMPA